MTFDFSGEDRPDFLKLAAEDMLKWCAPPQVSVDGRASDQFWICLFTSQNSPITEDEAIRFLAGFQLTNRVKWKRDCVARLMTDLRGQSVSDPVLTTIDLAGKLGIAADKGGQQISAASKILNFAKPGAEIFIWDRLARLSARYRYNDDPPPGAKGRYRDNDYQAFHDACRRILDKELDRDDFKATAASVTHRLRHGAGPMADPATVPDRFIQRRLLDKLMFWEGKSLEICETLRKAEADMRDLKARLDMRAHSPGGNAPSAPRVAASVVQPSPA